MDEQDDRLGKVEKRLDQISDDVGNLKADVQVLKGDVQVLKGDVQVLKGDVQVLKGDVQVLKDDVQGLKDDVKGLNDHVRGLRVLDEDHQSKIRTIAEVQAHHGAKLDEHARLLREIRDELVPLRDLRDFVKRVADDHETRITTLEKHAGQ